jgi:hypothetical protein
MTVDPCGLVVAARHAGDQQRRTKRATEKRDRRVDLGEVDLGQGLMLEDVIVEAPPGELHPRLQRQANVLELAVPFGPGGLRSGGARRLGASQGVHVESPSSRATVQPASS